MPKFNDAKRPSRRAMSYEGGRVYTKSLENEWFNNLFSSLLEPQFYKATDKERYIDLTKQMIDKYGPEFVSKAAVFSRNELGLRSISELTAAILNDSLWDGKRKFYASYFHRPDDVGEVFGAIDQLGSKRSHALVRGAADYLSTLDDYKLIKYRMNRHQYRMCDLINITHAHSSHIDAFKQDRIQHVDTWESLIVNEHDANKREAQWKRLVEDEKLGYLALLRNLRVICQCKFASNESWISKHLKPQLTNSDKISKSLVWPYQIYQAWRSIDNYSDQIKEYLEDAFYTACQDIPVLGGNTLMVLDVSGSMDSPISEHSSISIKDASAVYLAAYLTVNTFDSDGHADVIKFGNNFKPYTQDANAFIESPFDLIENLARNDKCGYGTDISPVFEYLISHKIQYDRILLFSDMQIMDPSSIPGFWRCKDLAHPKTANQLFMQYRHEVSSGCKIYSFDLGNYPTQLVSDDSTIRYITSLSDQVFKFIQYDEGESFADAIKNYAVS